jgi:hypothetical protein
LPTIGKEGRSKGVCRDESGIIVSAALRCLTVSGFTQTLLAGESNAEEQYQDQSVSIHHSDSFPPPGVALQLNRGFRKSRSIYDI